MGLNNVKANDYVNVVVQVLNRVAPFRNFFLRQKNIERINDVLVQIFAELLHKINNPRAFKSHVSPHEFLQAMTRASRKMFTLTQQGDPFQLLSWLLTTLDGKLQRHKQNIVTDTFQV